MLPEYHLHPDSLKQSAVPNPNDSLTDPHVFLGEQVLSKHLACIIDLESAHSPRGQPMDNEVSHRKEQVLVSQDLLGLLAPCSQDCLEP